MNDVIKEHATVVLGLAASLTLLALFMVFQYFDAPILELPVQWLVASAIPLFVAVFIGGYIRRFKGFGVELEARLRETIDARNLLVDSVAEEVKGDLKRGLEHLRQMPEAEKRRIKRLTFFTGPGQGYRPEHIEEYFRQLPLLKFVEVVKPDGRFVGLIPVSVFKSAQGPRPAAIERLVRSLESETVPAEFRNSTIVDAVEKSSSLVAALRILRGSGRKFCPVVDSKKRFCGVIFKAGVEEAIAEEVLATTATAATRS